MAINTYSLIPSYISAGQFVQNVLHYTFEDSAFGDTASAALALCNAFDANNTTHLRNLIPVQTVLQSYKSRCLTQHGGFEAIKLVGPQAGIRTGNLECAAVGPVAILFPTANHYVRGKVFLPGVTDTDCVNGEYTNAFRTNFTTHAVMFTNPITLTGGGSPTANPAVFRRFGALPGLPLAIQYVRLSDMVGTQRRRQRPA